MGSHQSLPWEKKVLIHLLDNQSIIMLREIPTCYTAQIAHSFSMLFDWLVPFSIAVLVALGTLYFVQFLRKQVEQPHREVIRAKTFLPIWTKMKEIEGHNLAPSMQEPTRKHCICRSLAQLRITSIPIYNSSPARARVANSGASGPFESKGKCYEGR